MHDKNLRQRLVLHTLSRGFFVFEFSGFFSIKEERRVSWGSMLHDLREEEGIQLERTAEDHHAYVQCLSRGIGNNPDYLSPFRINRKRTFWLYVLRVYYDFSASWLESNIRRSYKQNWAHGIYFCN